MTTQTLTEFEAIIQNCQNLFLKKNQDYGSAWRILRLTSITDQIYIKAKRIRTIQEKGTQQIADDINSEFVGIINYCVMALIQIELTNNTELDLPSDVLLTLYTKHVKENENLLSQKNHDYGEAWRDMRVSSMTDLILMKLLRIKQIEDNKGLTQVSEGVEAGYRDIINYSVFCLIKSN
jgi:hypothetical protein